MAKRRVEIGETGETVRSNVARIRKRKDLTLRDVADRLQETDRPLAFNTLSEIERGARRVDVDDLVALAAALEVSPSSILMPEVIDGDMSVKGTGIEKPMEAAHYWNWLMARESHVDNENGSTGEELLQFAAAALPPWAFHRFLTEWKELKAVRAELEARTAEFRGKSSPTWADHRQLMLDVASYLVNSSKFDSRFDPVIPRLIQVWIDRGIDINDLDQPQQTIEWWNLGRKPDETPTTTTD